MEIRCRLNQNIDGRFSKKKGSRVSACEHPWLEAELLPRIKDEDKGKDLRTSVAFSHPKCDSQRQTNTPIWTGDVSRINWPWNRSVDQPYGNCDLLGCRDYPQTMQRSGKRVEWLKKAAEWKTSWWKGEGNIRNQGRRGVQDESVWQCSQLQEDEGRVEGLLDLARELPFKGAREGEHSGVNSRQRCKREHRK